MARQIIGLDKNHGIFPVGVNGIWCHMMEKCVLVVAGKKSKQACRIEQLCAEMEVWIEGVTRMM